MLNCLFTVAATAETSTAQIQSNGIKFTQIEFCIKLMVMLMLNYLIKQIDNGCWMQTGNGSESVINCRLQILYLACIITFPLPLKYMSILNGEEATQNWPTEMLYKHSLCISTFRLRYSSFFIKAVLDVSIFLLKEYNWIFVFTWTLFFIKFA